MREILADIREKLLHQAYQNEEHVRLSLVCRLLFELGWDIWNPKEVNTEFMPIPTEDKTKVDIALFANKSSPSKSSPSIFVEVKAVGLLAPHLAKIEQQVRDYNRNNTALFSVITDGESWRLYYSQTGGEFHTKCFKAFDLINDNLEDIEQTFSLFFSKERIESGQAEEQAGQYLQLTHKQKAVQDLMPQARRLVHEPPFPSLPEAIVILAKGSDLILSKDEATKLLARMPEPPRPDPPIEQVATTHFKSQTSNRKIRVLTADNLGDLKFTKVEGAIGGKSARNWASLVEIALTLALQSDNNVSTWNDLLPINIREGIHTSESFSPIKGLNLLVRGRGANNCAKTLCLIAKKLGCQLELTVSWHGKSPHAGEQGILRWPSA